MVGLDLASSLKAKFGVRWPNKRKTWEVLVTQEAENWDIIPGKENLILFV